METLEADIVSFDVSELTSATVTALAAGALKVTGNGIVWLRPTLGLEGRLMDPNTCTVTFALAAAMFGRLLARITAVPAATPVTGTFVVVAA